MGIQKYACLLPSRHHTDTRTFVSTPAPQKMSSVFFPGQFRKQFQELTQPKPNESCVYRVQYVVRYSRVDKLRAKLKCANTAVGFPSCSSTTAVSNVGHPPAEATTLKEANPGTYKHPETILRSST